MAKETDNGAEGTSLPPERGEMDDRQLVMALMSDDETAWNYVVTELITPLVHANVKGIAEMLGR